MRTTLSRSVISSIDPETDIVSQLLADSNLFKHAFNFLFDRNPDHTFVCFGRMGSVMMGAAAYAGINSVVWVEDWTDVTTTISRVDTTAKTIIAVVDELNDDSPYYPQCWNDVASRIHMTPSSVSEIRCFLDNRTPPVVGVAAASIEANKLVTVSSVMNRAAIEKVANSSK
jgi:hypothetical protein